MVFTTIRRKEKFSRNNADYLPDRNRVKWVIPPNIGARMLRKFLA